MTSRSLDGRLDELQRRLRKLPPARVDFVTAEGRDVILSIGEGELHEVGVRPRSEKYMRWLAQHAASDLTGAPILLIGDNRAGQAEAGLATAMVLALAHGANVRLCTHPQWVSLAHETLRELLPPAWRDAADAEANHYPIGGGLEVASIRQQAPWTACDVVVIDYYSSGSERQVKEALRSAPVGVVCGEEPDSTKQQWICDYRDAAHAAGRLFRFRQDRKRDDIDRIVDLAVPNRRQEVDDFWRSTGL